MAFLRLERKASAPKAAEGHGRGRHTSASSTTTPPTATTPAPDKTTPILLSGDVIHHVEPSPDGSGGCRILTTGGETLDVVESFADVAAMVGVLPRH